MPIVLDLSNYYDKEEDEKNIYDFFFFRYANTDQQYSLFQLIRETFKQQLYKTSKDLLKIISIFSSNACYCNDCIYSHSLRKKIYLDELYDPQYFMIIFNNHKNNTIQVSHFLNNSIHLRGYGAEICLKVLFTIDHFKLFEKTKNYRFKTICKIINIICNNLGFRNEIYYFLKIIHLSKMPIEYYIYFLCNRRISYNTRIPYFELIYKK